jgi:hypothetical protein
VYGPVRDERERRTTQAPELEHGLEARAPLGEQADGGQREAQVARAPPLAGAAERVDAPDELGVEPDAGAEGEAAAVRAAEPDPPCPPGGELRGRAQRVARQPERTRQHARPATRHEPERRPVVGAVDGLVEAAVAGEDVDRRRPPGRLAHELRRVAGPLGAQDLVDAEDARDRRGGGLVHPRRVRVDDQHAAHGASIEAWGVPTRERRTAAFGCAS